MEEQSYYFHKTADHSNRKSSEKPLMINCAGCQHCRWQFDTVNNSGRNDYYLQYMIDGEMTISPSGVPQPFRKGHFILWEAETPFSYGLHTSEPCAYLWVHFTGFHAGRVISDLGLTMNRVYNTAPSKKSDDRICTLFLSMFDEIANRRPGTEEACAGILTSILVTLTREADKISVGKLRQLNTISYLHLHYAESTPVSRLAEKEHLSVSRYRELFHKQTGMSPVDYRTALRINHACRLLAQTDLTVAEIAADCGYSDMFFFMRIFKQKMGVTPGRYRVNENNLSNG